MTFEKPQSQQAGILAYHVLGISFIKFKAMKKGGSSPPFLQMHFLIDHLMVDDFKGIKMDSFMQ
jgi:hypothetical protein